MLSRLALTFTVLPGLGFRILWNRPSMKYRESQRLLRAQYYGKETAEKRAEKKDTEAATELGELIVRAIIEGEPVDLSNDLVERAGILAMAPEVYAALGDAENTIEALQRASRTGGGLRSLLSMKINPSYDFIRDDSRFVVLLEEVGLSE